MPLSLKRYQQEGDDHFITFSCHHRKPYLNTPTSRDIFLDSLERPASITNSKSSATSSCRNTFTCSSVTGVVLHSAAITAGFFAVSITMLWLGNRLSRNAV
jgi:hypothetical protein